MAKYMIGLYAAVLLASILPAQLNAAERPWGKEYPEARRALMKIFKDHKNFRETFSKWLQEHPKQAEELVDYVADDEKHTVEDFVKKHAPKDAEERREKREKVKKEQRAVSILRRLWENHREAMKEFRDWAHNHPKAAKELVKHPKLIEALEEEAEKRD